MPGAGGSTKNYFYPRSPCGERPFEDWYIGICRDISIHALLAESDQGQTGRSGRRDISIHALLAESDERLRARQLCQQYFYPRSPCGERQLPGGDRPRHTGISIHALLAESDPDPFRLVGQGRDFYPRSPCGERQRIAKPFREQFKFLSTLSLRRATDTSSLMQCQAKFLSTLSLRRATAQTARNTSIAGHFYPRSPCGERLNDAINGCNPDFISIHALLAESDSKSAQNSGALLRI